MTTALAVHSSASDWPQWREPHRDGKSEETGLLKTWPEQGPKILWSIEGIGRGYSSASVKNEIVYATGMIGRTDYLQAIDPKGEILWKIPIGRGWLEAEKGAPTINIPTPLFHQGNLYVTSGYDHVVVMFRLSEDASGMEFVWKDATLDCHHGGVVLVDGYLYGSNWLDNARGNWICVEWKTGKTMYETKWQTKGSVIYADGSLYCYEERRGIVALVKPDPGDFAIVSQFRVKPGPGPTGRILLSATVYCTSVTATR